MAKIVKSQILIQSARFQCGLEPAPTEHRAPEPGAVRPEEHKLPRRCLPQVLREQLHEEARERQRPATGAGLRFLHVPHRLAPDLLQRADDAELAARQIQVLPPQPGQLAPAAPQIRSRADQRQ